MDDTYILNTLSKQIHADRTDSLITIGRWISNIERELKVQFIQYGEDMLDENTYYFSCRVEVEYKDTCYLMGIIAYCSEDESKSGFGCDLLDMETQQLLEVKTKDEKTVRDILENSFPNLEFLSEVDRHGN